MSGGVNHSASLDKTSTSLLKAGVTGNQLLYGVNGGLIGTATTNFKGNNNILNNSLLSGNSLNSTKKHHNRSRGANVN